MKKILVVEDDRIIAGAYRIKLGKAGYDVRVTLDSKSVFEQLGDFAADLIILDLVMPVFDGFEILKALKKDERYKDIPVLIVSNLGEREDIEKAKKLGASDYIIKTDMSMKKLTEKIDLIAGGGEGE